MKFKDCKVGVRIHHPWYKYGVIERVNEDIVTINFNGIKLFFFKDTTERNVKELERIKINRITPKQQYRYEKSDNVKRIYRELNKKYNIPKEYEINFYTFNLNGVIRIKYVDEDNNEFIVESRCSPEDKFDVKTGLEVAVKRLAEKLDSNKWFPQEGKMFYFVDVDSTRVLIHSYLSPIDAAIGNYFRTEEEARKNVDKIVERYKNVIEYANSLNT